MAFRENEVDEAVLPNLTAEDLKDLGVSVVVRHTRPICLSTRWCRMRRTAYRCIKEAAQAVKTTKERWCEADIYRMAGEIALISPERDAVKAEEYFERARTVARQQQAKSWELRTAMSLARLWRDQGKGQQARELLAPVYGWFTEGFDTRDLKEAKALLDELAA
jgi:predicted ATPase